MVEKYGPTCGRPMQTNGYTVKSNNNKDTCFLPNLYSMAASIYSYSIWNSFLKNYKLKYARIFVGIILEGLWTQKHNSDDVILVHWLISEFHTRSCYDSLKVFTKFGMVFSLPSQTKSVDWWVAYRYWSVFCFIDTPTARRLCLSCNTHALTNTNNCAIKA